MPGSIHKLRISYDVIAASDAGSTINQGITYQGFTASYLDTFILADNIVFGLVARTGNIEPTVKIAIYRIIIYFIPAASIYADSTSVAPTGKMIAISINNVVADGIVVT